MALQTQQRLPQILKQHRGQVFIQSVSKTEVSQADSRIVYQPTIWTDDFIQLLDANILVNYERVKELEQKVRSLLNADYENGSLSVLQVLEHIDDIERLGLGYLFQNDITRALSTMTARNIVEIEEKEDNVYAASLGFRLLRQHGYNVSQDFVRRFKDSRGDFMGFLKTDLKGLINLYEASYLAFEGERDLHEAKMHRLEARWYIDAYGLTKVGTLITVIDDIYDVYGSLDELKIFTDVVKRGIKSYSFLRMALQTQQRLPQILKQHRGQVFIQSVSKTEVSQADSRIVYQPTIWTDDFIQLLDANILVNYERVKELEQKVRSLLNADYENGSLSVLQVLEHIDDIERLGLGYLFQNDITRALSTMTARNIVEIEEKEDNVYAASLGFRLLRQHGYNVSQDFVRRFKDSRGDFMGFLKTDLKGLINLYEASYLAFEGERDLHEAKMHRLEARWYIDAYGLTKVGTLITVIDDIYDVYGSLDELKIFTDVVKRWDINAIEHMPEHLQVGYQALYNTVNELGSNTPIALPILVKEWGDLLEAFYVEAKWTHNKYIPTLEDYLNNAWRSVSGVVILTHGYFLINKETKKDMIEPLEKYHELFKWSSTIFRLCNDLGTSSDEIKQGKTANAISCYMHENGVCEEVSREYIKNLIDEAWRKIIKAQVACSQESGDPFVDMAINLARMSHCTYQYGDGFGAPDARAKDRVISVIIEPIKIEGKEHLLFNIGSQRKTISPYDATSLDNPRISITQVQLKGDNYDEWSRSLRTALRARKKFGFIDGTIKQPEEMDKDAEYWWMINSLLVSWIRNTIEPSLHSTISHVEIAKIHGDDLKDRFDRQWTSNSTTEIRSCKFSTKEVDYRGGIGANTGTSDSNVIPLPVELPDGNIAMAKKKGDVRFNNNLILKNVLISFRGRSGTNLQVVVKNVFLSGIRMGKKIGEPIVPSVNDTKYNDTEIHEEPPSQDRGNELMNEDTMVHENQTTWTIEELPSNKKDLGCKYVYKVKYKSDGTIERFKVRLVILGNHQVEGIDYNETFTPVIKMVTVRVFLVVGASKQWELHQMDVRNAFLHVDLEEEVIMKLPLGLNKGKHGEACKLQKSLYTLRQASRSAILDAKPAKILMEQNHCLGLAKGRLFKDPKQYRRLGVLNMAYWMEVVLVLNVDHSIIYSVSTDVDTTYSSNSGNGLEFVQVLGYDVSV
nr:(E)-beta-ocimene synthase, chloroplastic-like [Tanacetum cinerariifolium]